MYAIPLTDLDSTAKVPAAGDPRGGRGRGGSVDGGDDPACTALAASSDRERRPRDEYFAVVLRHGERRGFLVVDELIEEREIVIKPVDDLLNPLRLFSGVSVLEDGQLVFILDTSFIRRENF